MPVLSQDGTMAFISYLGSVIRFHLLAESEQTGGPNGNNNITLTASTFNFSLNTRRFEEAGKSEGLVLKGYELQIVSLKNISVDPTGDVLPCLLIQGKQTESCFVNWLVIYVPEGKRLFTYARFRSDVSLCNGASWVSDGPSVTWLHGSALKYARKGDDQSFKVRHTCIHSLPWDAAVTAQIKHCWSDRNQELHLILAKSNKSGKNCDDQMNGTPDEEKNASDCAWVEVVMRGGNSAKRTEQQEDTCREVSLFPPVYAAVACCMHAVISSCGHNRHRESRARPSKSLSEPSAEEPERTEWTLALIATSMKQLLTFRNGRLHRLVWIPFDDADSIVAMEIGGEKIFAVTSKGGGVCLVRDSSFQVFKEWSNVSSVHSDGFLANAQHQLLLLRNTNRVSSPHQFPEFVLTDLGLCLITSERLLCDGKKGEVSGQESSSSQTSHCPRNLLATVEALQMHVKHGLASIQEQRAGCRQKERMIERSRRALGHMTAGEAGTNRREPTLVHLCGRESEGTSPFYMPHTCDITTERLKVTDGWQRVFGEKWVIGCKVTNQSKGPTSDLYLLVLPTGTSRPEAVLSEGYVRHPSSSRTSTDDTGRHGQQPPGKRVKLESVDPRSFGTDVDKSSSSSASSLPLLSPGKACDLVAVTTLPDFRDGPMVSCRLAVQWTAPGTEDGQARVQSFVCGSTTLGASAVAGNKLEVRIPHSSSDDAGELLSVVDRLALDACQLTCLLAVTSRYTQLTGLPSMLGVVGCRAVGRGAMHDGMRCSDGALRGTRVYIGRLSSRRAQLRVCTKDKRQLMLFQHMLLSRVPDDVVISDDTPLEQVEHAVTDGVSWLNAELEHAQRLLEHAKMSTSNPAAGSANETDGTATDRAEGSRPAKKDDEEREKLARLRRDFQEESCQTRGQYHLPSRVAILHRQTLLQARYNADSAIAGLSECVSCRTMRS